MKNADKPAYPNRIASKLQGNVMNYEIEAGLTKRERFAMAAMQGLVTDDTHCGGWTSLAYDAVNLADALLQELENTED